MKKKNYLLLTAFAVIILFSGFSMINMNEGKKKEVKKDIPENVNAVLQKTCSGCHSTASTNDKAKEKLNLTNWNNYSATAQISKLDGIHKTVSEGEMPPKKFLDRFPDKKLTSEEAKILTDWAKQESKRLSR